MNTLESTLRSLFTLQNQASVVTVLPGFVQQHCQGQRAALEAFGETAGCTNPSAECSAQASVTHQPMSWLTTVHHSGLGEATGPWTHRSQKEPSGESAQHSQLHSSSF